MTAYYTEDELRAFGFKRIGKEVKLSRKASIYGAQGISIGDWVRIDDFCILSAGIGGIEIHNYIHIGPYSAIMGGGKVTLEDYANISARVTIYSSNDDYSGSSMTNPLVPNEFKNVLDAEVKIGKHAIVGCGVVILPGVTVAEGGAVGALSLMNISSQPFEIFAGVPARLIKIRSRELLETEKLFVQMQQHSPSYKDQ
jgi:acetyltransferase-like isoleucine patch superfamily enzyme